MYVHEQKSYKNFENVIDQQLDTNSSMAILSIPGMGATFNLKHYFLKHQSKNMALITDDNYPLSQKNFLDLDFNSNDHALSIVDKYMKSAMPDQKFIILINSPSVFESSTYKNSYCSSHIYSSYYFPAMDREDSDLLALGHNKNLSAEELEQIYELSGGIGRIVKYLALKGQLDIESVLFPIIQEINYCSPSTLVKLGLIDGGEFKSSLVNERIRRIPINSNLDIKVNFDLSFSENNKASSYRLTKVEKDFITFAQSNYGAITKEKIAELKWGEGKYEDFSDQAIKQQILRLNKKLKCYKFSAITGVGYQLVAK